MVNQFNCLFCNLLSDVNKVKPFLYPLIYASVLTGLCAAEKVIAQTSENIQEVCLLSQLKCLTEIDKRQPVLKDKSFEWFQLEMLRHSSLFELERFDDLIATLEPWQNYNGLPHSFSLSVAIHKAKMLLMVGDKEAANRELDYAVSLLSDITNFNGNPMLIVMMANALLVMGEYEQGYKSLLDLELKYQHSPDPLLKREMYANLGHLASRLDRLNESIIYRQQSLEAAIDVGNTQQIGVAYSNLAAAYKVNEQYFEAIKNFQYAVNSARQSLDKHTNTKAKLRMTECYIAIGNFVNAKDVLSTINANGIGRSSKVLYDDLMSVVYEKSPAN